MLWELVQLVLRMPKTIYLLLKMTFWILEIHVDVVNAALNIVTVEWLGITYQPQRNGEVVTKCTYVK